jgi:hypothetical protein
MTKNGDLVPVSSPMLVRLDAACRALAEAKTIDEAKALRDTAEVMRHYYAQRGYGLRAINDAAEIKIRAERKMGEIISSIPGFGRGKKSVTMTDLGIDENGSRRWQQMARLDEDAFEEHVAEVRGAGQELTTAGVLRLARELSQPGKQAGPPLQEEEAANGDHFLVEQADCLSWFASQPADSIDLVFGSPPYEQARLYLENGEDPDAGRSPRRRLSLSS